MSKPLLAWVIIVDGKVKPDIYAEYEECMDEARRWLGRGTVSVANLGVPDSGKPTFTPTVHVMDHSHLIALQNRLANEKKRYQTDNHYIRKVWIDQIEKEIQSEKKLLCMTDPNSELSDEQLIALLSS